MLNPLENFHKVLTDAQIMREPKSNRGSKMGRGISGKRQRNIPFLINPLVDVGHRTRYGNFKYIFLINGRFEPCIFTLYEKESSFLFLIQKIHEPMLIQNNAHRNFPKETLSGEMKFNNAPEFMNVSEEARNKLEWKCMSGLPLGIEPLFLFNKVTVPKVDGPHL